MRSACRIGVREASVPEALRPTAMSSHPVPSHADVQAIEHVFRQHALGRLVGHRRVRSGTHRVYFCLSDRESTTYVVRLATVDHGRLFASAVLWRQRLTSVGVPVAPILFVCCEPLSWRPAYMILPRLAGDELLAIVDTLSEGHLHRAAVDWTRIQAMVGSLPQGRRYGLAIADEDAGLHDDWIAFLRCTLIAAGDALNERGVVADRWSARIGDMMESSRHILGAVTPKPFLDDLCHKNFLVTGGRIVAVLDADVIGFGDCLYALGQTFAGLARARKSTAFVEFVCRSMAIDESQRQCLRLYSALFLLVFLSKTGRPDWRGVPEAVDQAQLTRICDALDEATA